MYFNRKKPSPGRSHWELDPSTTASRAIMCAFRQAPQLPSFSEDALPLQNGKDCIKDPLLIPLRYACEQAPLCVLA
jgi:hypothetical protein